MTCPRTLLSLLLVVLLPSACTTRGGGGGGDDDDNDAADDDASDDDDNDDPLDLADADGDSIADDHEGSGDPDGDGIPNTEDGDSDGDGYSDADEAGDSDPSTAPADSDHDGVPDFLDVDSDDNGIPDAAEPATDTDGDGEPDAQDEDNDGDGIDDAFEIGLNPAAPADADGDGIPDYLDQDSDNDGVPDEFEGTGDQDGDGIPSRHDDDSDGDGIPDSVEVGPDAGAPADHDFDGLPDFLDDDSDNDGLLDDEEGPLGTDGFSRDTDGDGFSDLAEHVVGTNPNDASSVIDGYYAELSPRVETTIQVPFTPEILQADILFVLDTTCSMSGVLQTMAQNFGQVVSQITIPNVAFGVAEFDDYPTGGLGNLGAGDLPYRLTQQITTSTSLVQTGLSSLFTRDGSDGPESSMEAVYQAATGRGYDLDCDGSYQSGPDVPPFRAMPGDAFGGTAAGVYNPGVPGTGTIGGAGFRPGSLPIIVYTTDNNMRDADGGYSLPPTCGGPAGTNSTAMALFDIAGKVVGVGTNSTPISQMTALAWASDSVADIDGNGTEEPLVYEGTSGATVTLVIDAIDALTNGGSFDLSLVVDDDPYDFVTGVAPLVYPDVTVGNTVTFTLSMLPAVPVTSSDQVFIFPMQVIGDGVSILAEWELVLLVRAG